MLLIIPLHFVAFSHPVMVFFAVPLVTVGHNIQYHDSISRDRVFVREEQVFQDG